MCHSTAAVIRKTKRGNSLRYYCKACPKYFSIKTVWFNAKALLNDHLDGVSFRALGRKYRLSPMKAWRICQEGLTKLPDNNRFSFNYCRRFSNTFVFDGKYFPVAGQSHDWVLLWGIDYFKHDIPIFLIAPAESYHAWSKFFFYFRLINHHPGLIVCDDNVNLKLAARQHFPSVKIQTCFNHFKENIRRELRVRSDKTYREFMTKIETVLAGKLADSTLTQKLFNLYQDYREDPVAVTVLTNIQKYLPELTGYRGIPRSPVTSNMIEGLNSHLETRLFGLRSFQSVTHARLWFNGYVLKRRLTKFTDCRGKFRSLNGKCGAELTKKPEVDIPRLF